MHIRQPSGSLVARAVGFVLLGLGFSALASQLGEGTLTVEIRDAASGQITPAMVCITSLQDNKWRTPPDGRVAPPYTLVPDVPRSEGVEARGHRAGEADGRELARQQHEIVSVRRAVGLSVLEGYRLQRGDYVLQSAQEDPSTGIDELGHTLALNINEPVHDLSRFHLYDVMFDRVRAQGGLTGYAHIAWAPDWYRKTANRYATWDSTLNVIQGRLDFFEILQFRLLDRSNAR